MSQRNSDMHFENDRAYQFRRTTDAGEENATFTKFADGSAVVSTKDSGAIYEQRPDAWEQALGDLQSRGFLIVEKDQTSAP